MKEQLEKRIEELRETQKRLETRLVEVLKVADITKHELVGAKHRIDEIQRILGTIPPEETPKPAE